MDIQQILQLFLQQASPTPGGLINNMQNLDYGPPGGGGRNGPVVPGVNIPPEDLQKAFGQAGAPPLQAATRAIAGAIDLGLIPPVDESGGIQLRSAGPDPFKQNIVTPARRWLGLEEAPVASASEGPATPVGPTPIQQIQAALSGGVQPQTIELPGMGRGPIPMPPTTKLPPKRDFSDIRAGMAADAPAPLAQDVPKPDPEDVWGNIMIALANANWNDGAGPGLLQVAGNLSQLKQRDRQERRGEERELRRERRADQREDRADKRADRMTELQLRTMEQQDELQRARIEAENQQLRYRAELENASRMAPKFHGIEGGAMTYSTTGPDGKMQLHVQPIAGLGASRKLSETALALGASKDAADAVAAAGVAPNSVLYIPSIMVHKIDRMAPDLWKGTEKQITELTDQIAAQNPGLPPKALEDMLIGAVTLFKAQHLMSNPEMQKKVFALPGMLPGNVPK